MYLFRIVRVSSDSNVSDSTLSYHPPKSKFSTKTGRGKQTTTFSEIFNIKNNGSVVDTPGFKDFYFHDIEKSDLKFLYPEFKTKNNQCKFNNCNHINEPGCIIKKNVGETISERRYNNYLSIIDELD